MTRTRLINEIIQVAKFKNYLEIGTRSGDSLYQIICKNKIAIDPNFIISKKEKIKRKLFDFKNSRKTYYFEMTSNDFFKNQKQFLKEFGTIDISLVDGLHTFEQALLDVLHQLEFINERSVIILHDCFPVNYPASLPFNSEEFHQRENHEEWNGCWNGDVWKAIHYLREKYPTDLDVFVFDDDFGLGIVQRKNLKKLNTEIDYDLFNKINSKNYNELITDASKYIGLKPKEEMNSFISKFKY